MSIGTADRNTFLSEERQSRRAVFESALGVSATSIQSTPLSVLRMRESAPPQKL